MDYSVDMVLEVPLSREVSLKARGWVSLWGLKSTVSSAYQALETLLQPFSPVHFTVMG